MKLKRDYPFIFAKISARKSKLYDMSEYEELSRLTPSEIVERMQRGSYADSVNKLQTEFSGSELIEASVYESLEAEYVHLSGKCPQKLRDSLEALHERHKVEKLRRYLRWKQGSKQYDIKRHLPRLEAEEITDQSVLDHLGLQEYEECIDSEEEQTAITNKYFERLEVTASTDTLSKLFKMMREEQDISNLGRMVSRGVSQDTILSKLVDPSIYRRLGRPKDLDTLLEAVESVIGLKADNLKELERGLKKRTLSYGSKMLHREPLKAEPIVGYMISKEAEAHNLIRIGYAAEDGTAREVVPEMVILP